MSLASLDKNKKKIVEEGIEHAVDGVRHGSFGSIGKTLAGGLGVAAGLEMYGLGKKLINKRIDSGKINRAVAYAKSKHPELRRRSDKDLRAWMSGIYAIAPRVATSEALAASALVTIDAYNGNFDLATAKIIADINRGGISYDNNLDKAIGIAGKLG